MEAFLPDDVKLTLLGLLAIVFVLGGCSRAFPEVAWLQFFRLPTVQRSEAEKARRRRSANRVAGVEMILFGLVLPMFHIALTVMFFNSLNTLITFVVGACSVLCIALGIWAIVSNR